MRVSASNGTARFVRRRHTDVSRHSGIINAARSSPYKRAQHGDMHVVMLLTATTEGQAVRELP
jgi:hypothetical protein